MVQHDDLVLLQQDPHIIIEMGSRSSGSLL
jgi:cephalosporin hydroxylase